MSEKVMVLENKMRFKNSVPKEIIDKFTNNLFVISENKLELTLFEWFDKGTFLANAEAFIKDSKSNKNRILGDLIVTIKNSDNVLQSGKYSVSKGKFKFEPCSIHIAAKNDKEAKKPLTDEEKFKLYKEFWDLKHITPNKSDVYKDFRIGAFYAGLLKNDNSLKIVNDLMKD